VHSGLSQPFRHGLSDSPSRLLYKLPLSMARTARIGWCERLCYECGTLNVQLINLVDFLAGCMFLIFGIYLYTRVDGSESISQSAWIVWCSLILGVLLLLTTFFSFCAITNTGCRCLMWMSCQLAVLLAGLDFGAGISAFVLQKRFYSFLNEHGNEDGITDSEISDIKQWYVVIACMMLGSCVLEIWRYVLSRGYSESSRRVDGEFDALMGQDELQWNERLESNTAARSEKYRDLRSHYKNKYANYARSSADSASIL
jgi:hypothetical protein